mgnify:CR=1 FL=1
MESAVATAAVIGCGDVSIVHLEAIAAVAEAQLIAVCDADAVTAAAVARDREVVPFTDHRQMLQTLRPDVVHICTLHDQHAQLAIDCLEAGVSVILEKPLAHNVSEADRVIAAADRHPNVKIGVCLQNRYNATVQAVHALLASDELGAVVGGSATLMWHRTPEYYRASSWRGQFRRSGGGVLINQAIHTLISCSGSSATSLTFGAMLAAMASTMMASTSKTPPTWFSTTNRVHEACSSPLSPMSSTRP